MPSPTKCTGMSLKQMCTGPWNLEVAPTQLLDLSLNTFLAKNHSCVLLNSWLLVSNFSVLTCMPLSWHLSHFTIFAVIFMLTLCSLGDYEDSEGKDSPSILTICADWLYNAIYSPMESKRIKVVFYGFFDNCTEVVRACTHAHTHTNTPCKLYPTAAVCFMRNLDTCMCTQWHWEKWLFWGCITFPCWSLFTGLFPQVDYALTTAAFSRFPWK